MTDEKREKLVKVKEKLEKQPKGISVGVFDEKAFMNTMDSLVEKLGSLVEQQGEKMDEAKQAMVQEVKHLAGSISSNLAKGMIVTNADEIKAKEEILVKNLKDIEFPSEVKMSNFDVSKLATEERMAEIKAVLEVVAQNVKESAVIDQTPQGFTPVRRVIRQGNNLVYDDAPGGHGGSWAGNGGGASDDPVKGSLQAEGNASLTAIETNTANRTVDYYPGYSTNFSSSNQTKVDPSGSLITRGAVLTDEGTGRINFTGDSLSRPVGTMTFEPGSAIVTGSGFSVLDIHQSDAIKLDSDDYTAWNTILFIDSDEQITLISPYLGAGGTGDTSVAPLRPIEGFGSTISVADGQATMSLGTVDDDFTLLYTPIYRGSGFIQASMSISQRIDNQDIFFGLESAPFDVVKELARFRFTGTTDTEVICETGHNPTTAPSDAETESTAVSIPSGGVSSGVHTYKIELANEAIIFSIDSSVVATHTKRIPHIQNQPYLGYYVSVRAVNGTSPISNTNVVMDYAYGRVYNRLDMVQTTPGDASNSQVVQQRAALMSTALLQDAATGTGNGTFMDVQGMATVALTVTISNTATITFEAREDSGSWTAINGVQDLTGRVSTTATSSGIYTLSVSGFVSLRTRVSSYGSGSVTVSAHASPQTTTSRVVALQKADTSVVSSVGSSNSSVTLLASNPARIMAVIYNDSTAALYIKLGTTASSSSFTHKLGTQDSYSVPGRYTGRIDGVWASVDGNARITELT